MKPLLPLLLLCLLAACSQPDPPTVALYLAVHRGDLNQIQRHIHHGTDINLPDADGDTPLHVAAESGRVGIIELLLDHGAHTEALDRDGRTPLEVALQHGRTQVAELLIGNGAALDPTLLLLRMAGQGVDDRDVLELLLRRGARIDEAGADGDTALLIAIRHGNRVLAKRLIEHGADLNHRDSAGRRPLDIATEQQQGEIIRLLQRQGALPGD